MTLVQGLFMKLTEAHFLSPSLFIVALCLLCSTLAAQTTAPSPSAAPQPAKTASAAVQPALDSLQQILDVLRPEKWKASGTVREEMAANINSIRRDLATTLPPLLTNADSAPDSVAHVLPAYRNIEALYDVLLRVTETSKLSAPSQQAITLQQTLASLENARRALGEQLQSAAVARDQQVHDLQVAARMAAQRASAPVPAPCPPPPHTKRRTRSKTVHKPTASSTSSKNSSN